MVVSADGYGYDMACTIPIFYSPYIHPASNNGFLQHPDMGQLKTLERRPRMHPSIWMGLRGVRRISLEKLLARAGCPHFGSRAIRISRRSNRRFTY